MAVQTFHDRHDVRNPDRRHVAHRAVGEDLDLRRLSPADLLGEIGADLEGDIRLSLEERLLHLTGIINDVPYLKQAVGAEGVHDRPAFGGPGLIEEDDADGLDVEIHDIAEDQDLNQRRHDENGAVPPVPEELDEFLAHQFPDPQPTHPTFPPVSERRY